MDCLCVQNDNIIHEHEGKPTCAEIALQKIRNQQSSLKIQMDLRFLTPTSSHFEPLFLEAGRVSIGYQNFMTPGNFEYLMFLFSNRDLGSILDEHPFVSRPS